MHVFTRKCGSPICHVLLTTKHESAGALINRQQTIYWTFTQTSRKSGPILGADDRSQKPLSMRTQFPP